MAVYNERLSPSGPFIGNPPLRRGFGSCGLVWRAQGAAGSTPFDTTPLAVTFDRGDIDAGEMVLNAIPGFVYDTRVQGIIRVLSNQALGNAQLAVEFQDDDQIGIWQPLFSTVTTFTEAVNADTQAGSMLIEGVAQVSRVLATPTITRMRVLVSGTGPDPGNEQSFDSRTVILRVCQYALP